MNKDKKHMEQIDLNILNQLEETENLMKIKSIDKKARNRIIELNLPLVFYVVKKYGEYNIMSYFDLIQEGNIGLIKAVDNYEPDKGIKFSTYAVCCIERTINRALNNYSRLIRIPSNTAIDLNRYNKSKQMLEQNFQGNILKNELKELLDISNLKLEEFEKMNPVIVSISTPINCETKTTIEETIVDEKMNIQLDVENKIELERIRSFVRDFENQLTELEKQVFYKRIYTSYISQAGSVAKNLNITTSKLNAIEAKVLRKVRKYAYEKGLN